MSRKRTIYTAAFKTKLVLEVLKDDQTLVEIASKNKITPKNLQNWKKMFLENAEMAMEPSKAVKEYKDANAKLQIEVGEYAKKVGQLTLEKDWAVGKLGSLDLKYILYILRSKKLEMVDECRERSEEILLGCRAEKNICS